MSTAGLEYRSDQLWEFYIEKETERKNLRFVTDLFRRVISTPTKLYNKHWDNLIAHVRDYHPRDILQYQDYDSLRRLTCRELGLTYRPDPVSVPEVLRKVELPSHEATEIMVDQIYRLVKTVASC